ncbi:MAG: 16S rRNA (guanine(966)-N(2))-methyltransferase RsmD [Gracilibacter sp. BRH_c7a]|nr:MAG: 16S rRNA (guanine(966)-N(2))-methyltransferase RsmD [Gracilibacter sp. BRH_c7a]
MRIISGDWKGRRLKTLQGNLTRPTSDKVKGAIFNILGNKVQSAKVLDLFAGTGNLSLEALSRGAEEAVLVEKSRKAWEIISDNIKMLEGEDSARIYNMDVFSFLKQPLLERYDLVFIDPPYRQGFTDRVLTLIKTGKILNPQGVIIIETASDEEITDDLGFLEVMITKQYGDTKIWFIQQRDQQEEV